MRPAAVLLLMTLVGLTGLAGCGDDDPQVGTDEPAPTAPSEDPIAGRTFEATGLESETTALVEGTPLRIGFADDQITVETGCNRLTGSYSLDGPILVVEDLGGTEMGCEPDLMAQESWMAEVLTTRPVITPQPPDGLQLAGDGWTLTLADVATSAEPAQELAGPTWTLDTLIDEESASSLPEGVAASITFADDGTYAVVAGCNTGSGTYAEAGTGLYQLEAPAITRRRCDDAAMEVESAVLAVLDGEVAVSIEGDRLTITAPGGGEDQGSPSGQGLAFTAA